MGVASVLTKEKLVENGLDIEEIDIQMLTESASQVIAPLWPISIFAARNPWMGLEKKSFDEVADWLKNTRNVDIYPSVPMILSAMRKGEIDEDFVNMGLKRWIDSQFFNVPRDVAERYCHAALKLDSLPSNLLSSSKLVKLAEEFSGLDIDDTQHSLMQPKSTYIENQDGNKMLKILDHHIIKWCKLYLDNSYTGWTMPNREEGFYRAWKRLIQYDPALSKKERECLKDWPQDAHKALKESLFLLGIHEQEIQSYLEGHLLSLPGWAGLMLWRSQQSNHEHALLTEYLAVRISMEWVLLKPYLPLNNVGYEKKTSIVPLIASWIYWGGLTIEEWSHMSAVEQTEYLSFAYKFDENLRRKIWLEAWERTYTDRLSQKLISKPTSNNKKSTLAQLVFCIDVRSEPFRRQLEKEGPFETIGMAGFFGLPIETNELDSHHSHASLPVILKPQHKIKEVAAEKELKLYRQRKHAINSINTTFKSMKQNVLSNLLLPELSGPWLSLQIAARSFVPRRAGHLFRNLHKAWLRKPKTEFLLNHTHDTEVEIPIGFSNEDKVNYVRQALKLMGLTENFAPLVVICGHRSQNTNNPYAAALDCGACGGAAGGFNAKVLATLCNLTKVREELCAEGIDIPEDTVFAAAEHITTVDELHWIYVPELSQGAKEAFDCINAIMTKVSHKANSDRIDQLPKIVSKIKNPHSEAHRLAEDWSEVRPEWGLARNAAFIIGQRELTQDCDLEGRAFLHNYDWKQDESGDLLANIIAGPGTVAQWINLQYYASTVAPHYYGSGNKATQTVTAGLGVMQGNASDLLAGLPWQSVMKSDYEAYHSPLRLLIVIQAPREYVERLLNKDPAFQEKVQNKWVRLASVDAEGRWENW
ncbi:DUF2309 domain-containing protein [Robertmurraya sp. Marseille-Q9965]